MKRAASAMPIAAHLGLLVALAFASAFVVMLAVVVVLPPRPPDVARGDLLMEQFARGFRQAASGGAPASANGVSWRIARQPPNAGPTRHFEDMQGALARQLGLALGDVRLSARTARSDVFVFRVREVNAGVHVVHRRVDENGRTIIVETQTAEAPPPPAELPHGAVSFQLGDDVTLVPSAPRPPSPPSPPMFAPAPAGVMLLSGYSFAAKLPDGRWLTMTQSRDWAQLSWIARAALVMGLTLAALSLMALLFARRLAKPIQSFARAVEAVGVDPRSAPVAETGPAELRGAARAINSMQVRLRALIADRTKTLAAVAHDMRTPLMRLRLTAENVAPEQRDRLAKEIGEVEALVASFIAFAREDPAEEARVRLDLSALLQSLADDHAEAGRAVSFVGEERCVVTAQSLGLKRLFANLIDNALKYGASARIRLTRGEGAVLVDVEDDGPGVPVAERERVFEPFVRLDEGETGAGLGLPAARSIARAHGGDIVFLDAEHGARARVSLPA